MKTFRCHVWHNLIAAEVDYKDRLAEIDANKPANELALRKRLMKKQITASQFKKLNAVNAKRQTELNAVYAKWQTELDAVHSKLCVPNCPWDGKTIFTHKDSDGNWCMKNQGKPVTPKY